MLRLRRLTSLLLGQTAAGAAADAPGRAQHGPPHLFQSQCTLLRRSFPLLIVLRMRQQL